MFPHLPNYSTHEHCNTLQHTAAHCDTLQHTAHTDLSSRREIETVSRCFRIFRIIRLMKMIKPIRVILNTLLVEVCCSTLQCVAICAVGCSGLQWVAACCSVLQCVAFIKMIKPFCVILSTLLVKFLKNTLCNTHCNTKIIKPICLSLNNFLVEVHKSQLTNSLTLYNTYKSDL